MTLQRMEPNRGEQLHSIISGLAVQGQGADAVVPYSGYVEQPTLKSGVTTTGPWGIAAPGYDGGHAPLGHYSAVDMTKREAFRMVASAYGQVEASGVQGVVTQFNDKRAEASGFVVPGGITAGATRMERGTGVSQTYRGNATQGTHGFQLPSVWTPVTGTHRQVDYPNVPAWGLNVVLPQSPAALPQEVVLRGK